MNIEQTSKEFFKGLSILHGALLVGQILIALILFYISGEKMTSGLDSSNIYSLIVPIAVFGGFAGSYLLSKHLITKAKGVKDLKNKMGAYRTALIAKWALLEGGALISIILFFIDNNLTFLIMAGALIAYFATTMPSLNKAIQDLDLSREEQGLLRKPDEIVARITSK